MDENYKELLVTNWNFEGWGFHYIVLINKKVPWHHLQCKPKAVSNYPFCIGINLLINAIDFRNNPGARRCPRWPSFGHFRPLCGSRWSCPGPNYPVCILNQLLFNTVGSRINPMARRCPRWQSFGHFRPPCGPRWSLMGHNYPYFIGNQLLLNTF